MRSGLEIDDPESWWPARRRALGLTVFVGLAVALYLVEIVVPGVLHPHDQIAAEAFLWVGGPVTTAVVGSWAYRRLTGRSVWGARRWRLSDIGWGVVAGGLIILFDQVFEVVAAIVVPAGDGSAQPWLQDALVATPVLAAIGTSLAAPFGEEVAFRGLVLRGLALRVPLAAGVLVSSVVFGLLHPERFDAVGWLLVVNVTVAGIVFAIAFLRTGHLATSITAHAVVNGAYTLLFLFSPVVPWTVGPDGDIPAIDLEVGECAAAAWWAGEALDRASQVPCDQSHDVEIAHRGRLGLGSIGGVELEHSPSALNDLARANCLHEFEEYVGIAWEESILDVVPVLPGPDAWERGDRELVCLIVPWQDDHLTEPARDSRR